VSSDGQLYGRDEYWTALGLDWVGTMTNFVDFGLDPPTS